MFHADFPGFTLKIVEYSPYLLREREAIEVKRYIKDDLTEIGIFYYEYDGDYNIRKIEIRNGQWNYATENHRRDYLADQPLSESERHPATWQYEISTEEFEKVWDEALKRSPQS